MKKQRKIDWIAYLIMAIAAFHVFGQIFEWLFINFYTDIGLRGKLLRFIFYCLLLIGGINLKLRKPISLKFFRTFGIGIILERLLVFILFPDYIIIETVIIDTILGAIILGISYHKILQNIEIKSRQGWRKKKRKLKKKSL